METLEQKIARVLRDEVDVVPHDPAWPESFRREKAHLESCLPRDLIRRIEHFGSTAVPGLGAKPVVDLLVEVTDLAAVRERVAPLLESQGYDYFWRPSFGDDQPPFYAWFIKRDAAGRRTHHVHMVEATPAFASHWDRLYFRDHLIAHPEVARAYERVKHEAAAKAPHDRETYTRLKSEFILEVTARAKREAVLRELERREPIFHRPELGTSRRDFEAMTEPGFWEVGASGRAYGRTEVLDLLEKRHSAPHDDPWKTRDFRCLELAPDDYLLTYVLEQGPRITRRATIWRRRGVDWTIVYHQGTIVQDS